MTAPALVPLVSAFFVGCIVTEIRWIVRMRRLRARVGGREDADTACDSSGSLHTLSRRFDAEAPVSPVREQPATLNY